ncbi:hypothetical protein HZS_4960 [Henneguya salminicola]|nr:hypothetical protein HZS_4960 [Henneguya salminicola]
MNAEFMHLDKSLAIMKESDQNGIRTCQACRAIKKDTACYREHYKKKKKICGNLNYSRHADKKTQEFI